ncbi:MAG: hypothetical protein JWN71_1768 [Xanthobacteraceae bacterium]|nr:hypothetical protein [Xanthobacteraceae bacterium]
MTTDLHATTSRHRLLIGLRVLAILVFIALTNEGFASRFALLIEQQRLGTLIGFVGIWGLSFAALLIAAFQPRLSVRVFWALVIAASTAAGFFYHQATGNELGPFDIVSLWSARHEAGRAFEFYAGSIKWMLLALVGGLLVMATPPAVAGTRLRRWTGRLALAPVIPIALIAAIALLKEGGGTQVLPVQFTPLSVGIVAGAKIAITPMPQRQGVTWTWRGPFAVAAPRGATAAPTQAPVQKPTVRHIVLLVDESLRADYIDWTPGNPYTPALAAMQSKLVNFGPAVSGGNCSHYSNAILRFAASKDHLGPALLTSPTIWQYAKKAGFRTVFIDAQAAFNRNPGKMQNFMTAQEARDIDGFYALPEDVAPSALDDRLLDIVEKELRSPQPVFIYANKNGAHFPYDHGYPAGEGRFEPSMAKSGQDTAQTRINSYRNVVSWSVDRFMKRVTDEFDLKDTVVIYTSDHGQAFNPGKMSHCTVEEPDPREGLVPLFVTAGDQDLRARFEAAAAVSRGHSSHFEIAPTMLELFGYAADDIQRRYGATLLEPNPKQAPAFTTGDIFGLFSSKVRWHPVDLNKSYLEPEAHTQPAARPSAAVETDRPQLR